MYRLTIVIITILLIISEGASASSSPPLPDPEIDNVSKEASKAENLSIWQKILTFLGLGGKQSEETKSENIVEQEQPKQSEMQLPPDVPQSTENVANNISLEQGDSTDNASHEMTANNTIGKAETKDINTSDENLEINDELFAKFDKKVDAKSDVNLTEDLTADPSKVAATEPKESFAPNNNNTADQSNIAGNVQNPVKPSSETPDNSKQTSSKEEANLTVNQKPEEKESEKMAASNQVTPIAEEKSVEDDKPSAQPTTADSNIISKFKQELEKRKNKRINDLAIIPESEMTASNPSEEDKLKNDPKQQKFVDDEAKVLIISNDDVVLGELTEEAKLELMDLSSYARIFWENYEKIKSSYKKEAIDQFIDNYDENFNSEKFLFENETAYEVITDAYMTVQGGDINRFIKMLNIYPMLGTVDETGTILHKVAKIGNYPATELLIMRGIALNLRDQYGQTALSVAKKYHNKDVIYLLQSAGAKD